MTYEVQVSIPYFNGLPEDCATNVLHFDRIGPTAPDNDDWLALRGDVVAGFYEAIYGAPGNHLAQYANPDAVGFKVYNLLDAVPRSPVFELTGSFGMVADATTTLPPEVAVVCSVHAAGTSGIAPASQRGRVYLGVLGDSVCSGGGETSFPTVDEGFRTTVNGAANSMVSDAITLGFTWVILSRVLATTFPIVGGHCDDAFDIQRRRGQQPTIRNTWGS